MLYILTCLIIEWVKQEANNGNLYILLIYSLYQQLAALSPYVIFTLASMATATNIRSIAIPTILNIVYYFKDKK